MALTIGQDTATIPVNKQLVQFNPASQLPIKLIGSTTFTTWKAQLEMLLQGHDLYGHLDGTTPAPAETLTENDKETLNPEYKLWFRQDKLIQNAILASIDPTLASMVAIVSTSKKAWDSLHTTFANKSQTRIFTLRDNLNRITKDNKPVAEYLREIRSVTDELAIAGSPVSHAELVVKILGGLGKEYQTIATVIRGRETPISYEDLFDRLLDEELLLQQDEAKQLHAPITAAMAKKDAQSVSPINSSWRPPHQQQRRFNQSNQWRPSQSNNTHGRHYYHTQQNSGESNRFGNQVQCQLCDKPGHTAKVCRSKSHSHVHAKANFVSAQSHQAPWIMDSGASHHITADSQHYSEVNGYNGPDEISLGDGKRIPISQTGPGYGNTNGMRPE